MVGGHGGRAGGAGGAGGVGGGVGGLGDSGGTGGEGGVGQPATRIGGPRDGSIPVVRRPSSSALVRAKLKARKSRIAPSNRGWLANAEWPTYRLLRGTETGSGIPKALALTMPSQ